MDELKDKIKVRAVSFRPMTAFDRLRLMAKLAELLDEPKKDDFGEEDKSGSRNDNN